MRLMHVCVTLISSCALLAVLTGCPKEGPAEQASDAAESAADTMKDTAEDAADAAEDTAEDAADAVEDATSE